jgi:hypothetical protein
MRVRWVVLDKNRKMIGTELLPRPAGAPFGASEVPHPSRRDWTMRRVWTGTSVSMTDTMLV